MIPSTTVIVPGSIEVCVDTLPLEVIIEALLTASKGKLEGWDCPAWDTVSTRAWILSRSRVPPDVPILQGTQRSR